MSVQRTIQALYESFNARDADAVLARMTDDVQWPNAWEGGRVQGTAAVRDYWSRQWAEIDPQVTPGSITTRPDGAIAVEVRQLVRDRDGTVLSDSTVTHVYRFRDELIERMDVEEPT